MTGEDAEFTAEIAFLWHEIQVAKHTEQDFEICQDKERTGER